MSVMEIEEPLRRPATVESSEMAQEDDGFLRANSMGGGRPAVAREADDGFVRVNRGAAPRTGDDLMAHMQPREREGGVREFFLDRQYQSPGPGRQLARLGMGMNGEATAGVPGVIAGQVAMNGLDVAEAAGLGGPNGFTGGLTGTMRRDIGRTAGIALTAAGRKAILDTGERPEDVAGDTRSELARVMAHRKALIEKRRAGGDVGRNAIGRSLVHKWAASTKHGANVEYMGHRPEFGYTMQESAAVNDRRAIRRAADGGAVKFIDRKPGTELVQPGQQPGEAPIVQTDAERRRGERHQNRAAITRGGDELGRILQNDEGGLDDLYKGNYGKAIAKGGVNTARNIGAGIGAALSGDPTGGYLAYPILDAGLKVAGAGVSAASQAIGHATGIEAKAQLQDDKDLYNQHYFGDKKGEGKPLDGFDTAREEQILRSGLRERGHADDIGSERAGLPQYDTGNAASSFLKQRLGKGLWTRWWRDAVTEPRAVGQIAVPAARGVGSTLKSAGKFAAKYTGLAFLGRKIRSALRPKYREKQRAKKAERDALIAPKPAADSGAVQAPSLADVLAPQNPVQQPGDPGPQEEEKEPGLLSQMQEGDPEPPARLSEAEGSRAGTLPAPELRESRVGSLLEEGEQGDAEGASESDQEMVRLAAQRQERAVIADEDSLLRKKLAKETKAKDTFVRNYVVGETLGFGKFDKARHNISAWISHFRDRDIRTGEDVHSKARKKDPAGYERKRQEELERIRKRLRGEELGPTGRSMLDVVPDMAKRMDREEAVRSGHDPGASRQAGDLGPDFDFDDILQRRGSEASDDSARATVSAGNRNVRNALSGAADVSEESLPAEPQRLAPDEGAPHPRDDEGERPVMGQFIEGQGPAQPMKEPGFFDAPAPLAPIAEVNAKEDHPANRPFMHTPDEAREWKRLLRRGRR